MGCKIKIVCSDMWSQCGALNMEKKKNPSLLHPIRNCLFHLFKGHISVILPLHYYYMGNGVLGGKYLIFSRFDALS